MPREILDASPAALSLEERERIATICSVPHLPQGAPTSPALANLCAWRLDCRLAGLARSTGAAYTRYADDLLFSGDRRLYCGLPSFRVLVLAILLDEGFSIRNRKTRVMTQANRQHAAGVVLNRHTNVARGEYDQLKAILHNCRRFGPHSQNRAGHADFRAHLRGKIAYIGSINEHRGRRLKELFDRIDWDRAASAVPDGS